MDNTKSREVFLVENGEEKLKVYIKSNLKVYSVVLVGKATVEKEEFCASKFKFTVLKDNVVSFNQGDAVSVKFGSEGIFFGYVFSKSRDKDGLIDVVAYDQMRYMKNKVCYQRGFMSLEETVRTIAKKNDLNIGDVDPCKVMLSPMASQSVSLLDVVAKGCNDVRKNSGERYIVFDDFGYLALKNEDNLVTDVLIDASQAENYVYTDTIDSGVYNKIQLYVNSSRMGAVIIMEDSDEESMNKWGTLVLSKRLDGGNYNTSIVKNMLDEYNHINREIVLMGVRGNSKLIPGSSVYVRLSMGDLALDGYMRVKKAMHIFENNLYKTNLYLDGRNLD
ncbi:MAG: hypothetical protein ACI3XA_09885 [Clostridia bacterium]